MSGIAFLSAGLLTLNVGNSAISSLFSMAENSVANTAINVIFGSISVSSILLGVGFGLKFKRMRAIGQAASENDLKAGILTTLPGLSLLFLPLIVLEYKNYKPEDKELPVLCKSTASHILLSNLGSLVIIGSMVALDKAAEIHNYFLHNPEFSSYVSEFLANVFNPEAITLLATIVMVVVSIPLLHSIFTGHKFEMSFAEPKESIAGQFLARHNLGVAKEKQQSSIYDIISSEGLENPLNNHRNNITLMAKESNDYVIIEV